jgi:hypothetical protein
MCLWYARINIKAMVGKNKRYTFMSVKGDLAVFDTVSFRFNICLTNDNLKLVKFPH